MNTQQFILKATGCGPCPSYVTKNGHWTSHIDEAERFDSIELARASVSDGRCYQILDATTRKCCAWVNY